MKSSIIFIVLIGVLFAGCDSPTDSFDRVNENDPLSTDFIGGPITGLQVSADTSGAITIQWSESNNVVTKNVIEKSLGDTMSFTPIAELDADAVKYVDSSLEVRKNTYYRLSSFVEIEGKNDVLYGRDQAQLSFGLIENDRFDFLEDSNSLQLSWNVDVPFYTHFIITSENVLTEQQENSVRIPAGTVEYTFEDPLLDIDFETRKYIITGIIEREEVDETVVEKKITFDAKSFFSPRNLQINVLNAQDWQVSWEGEAFFATGVELIRGAGRTGFNQMNVFNLPTGTSSYIDSLVIEGSCCPHSDPNHLRRYKLRFTTENGVSNEIEKSSFIEIISLSFNPISEQNDPNSLTLSWSAYGNDTDLIKGFIIEKATPTGPLEEYARVYANEPHQITDTEVDDTGAYYYRLRLMSSRGSTSRANALYEITKEDIYQYKYSIDTGMDYVTSMEMSSDNRYLVASSFREGSDNFIHIHDVEAYQSISEIRIPGEQISDFTISKDDTTIYFSVSSENAIYKADFPSGGNIEKIIDDAWVGSASVFNIDVSADNSFIVGTGRRGFVKKWSLVTYEADFVFAEYSTPTFYLYKNIAISPDGNFILANNGVPVILDAESGSVIKNLPWASQNVTDHQFSPNGDYFAFTSNFNSTHIYSTHNWIEDEVRPGQRIDFHPVRQEVLFSADDGIYTKDLETGYISEKFSVGSGQLIPSYKENAIIYIDDEKFATVSSNGIIVIYEGSEQYRWVRLF